MSMFGLQNLDLFLVLQLITDVVTMNRPGIVDNLLLSCPHFIYSPFLAIVEEMMSQGTTKPLVLIVEIIYMTVVAVAFPTTSYAARYAASLYYTLFVSSNHASL